MAAFMPIVFLNMTRLHFEAMCALLTLESFCMLSEVVVSVYVKSPHVYGMYAHKITNSIVVDIVFAGYNLVRWVKRKMWKIL